MKILNKINQVISTGKRVFVGFWMAGFCGYENSLKKLDIVTDFCDIVEIGFPCSDPIADGKTLTDVARLAIESGACTEKNFKLCKDLHDKKPQTTIVAIVYLNTILQFGIEKFFKSCKECFISGVIIPEIGIENSSILSDFSNKFDVDLIFIASSNTDDERFFEIEKQSKAFVYAACSPKVTGASNDVSQQTIDMLLRFKQISSLPILCGFGISNKDQVEKIIKNTNVDGIIIASKLFDFQDDESLSYFLKEISDVL